MKRRVARAGVIVVAMLVASPLAHAGELYRLGEGSSFWRGCFPPCMCPIRLGEDFTGTFTLDAIFPPGSSVRAFAMRDIDWSVRLGDRTLAVVGSGRYFIRQTKQGSHHRMVLKVTIGDEPARKFDSGLVPMTTSLPFIDISVSANNMQCFDTVLNISAVPGPQECGGLTGNPCEDPGGFGRYPDGTCDWADIEGECTEIPIHCPLFWDPVCGCDGVTYSNVCEANANSMSVDHAGICL